MSKTHILSDGDNSAYDTVIELSTKAISILDDTLQDALEAVGASEGVKLYWRHIGLVGEAIGYTISVKQEVGENGNVEYRAEFVEGGAFTLETAAGVAVTALLAPAIEAAGIATVGTVVVAVGIDYAVGKVFDREAVVGKKIRDMLRTAYDGQVYAKEITSSESSPINGVTLTSTSNDITRIKNIDGRTTVTYTPDTSNPLIASQQDIINAIIGIKESPIVGNPFFINPNVNITLPSGRFMTYVGTNRTDILNLINGDQASIGDTLVYTLGGDDKVGINGGVNLFDGGSGFDTVSYINSPQAIDVDLSAGSIVSGSGLLQMVDTIINVEVVIGTDYNDAFRGTPGAGSSVSFEGGKGDDTYELFTADRTHYRLSDSEGNNHLEVNGKILSGTASPVTNRPAGTTWAMETEDNLYILTRVDDVGVRSAGSDRKSK